MPLDRKFPTPNSIQSTNIEKSNPIYYHRTSSNQSTISYTRVEPNLMPSISLNRSAIYTS
uniref:Uncharacterized protein n=1 Tax=Arundo donax TaxID=35708 RepID=A0A0A9CV25_ARUDO